MNGFGGVLLEVLRNLDFDLDFDLDFELDLGKFPSCALSRLEQPLLGALKPVLI